MANILYRHPLTSNTGFTAWLRRVAGSGTSSATFSAGTLTLTATAASGAQEAGDVQFTLPAGTKSVRVSYQLTVATSPVSGIAWMWVDSSHAYGVYRNGTFSLTSFSNVPNADLGSGTVAGSAIPDISSGVHTIEYFWDNAILSCYIDDVFAGAISITAAPTILGLGAASEAVAGHTTTQLITNLTFADGLQAAAPAVVVPNAPIMTAHAPINTAVSNTFTFTFSDNDVARSLASFLIKFQRADTGAQVYFDGVVSGTGSYTLPANSLTPGLAYIWSVQTFDDHSVGGAWGSSTVIASSVPTAAITYPPNDGYTNPFTSASAVWTITDPDGLGQSAYQIRLTDNSDVQIETTGKVTSATVRGVTMATVLTNGTTYKLKVTVWNVNGLSSTEVVRTFTVNTAVPPTPTLTVTPNSGGYNAIAITNPAPGGGIPDAASNDIYRRIPGGTYVHIANVVKNGTYNDYNVWLGSAAQYEVVANATSGTTATSAGVTATLSGIAGLLLHSVAAPSSTYIAVQFDEARQQQITPGTAMLQFQGRARPVAEFAAAAYATDAMQIGLTMLLTDTNHPLLVALSQRTDVLCYRDQRGRRLFGTITSYQETDDRVGGWSIQFTFSESDYSEAG